MTERELIIIFGAITEIGIGLTYLLAIACMIKYLIN